MQEGASLYRGFGGGAFLEEPLGLRVLRFGRACGGCVWTILILIRVKRINGSNMGYAQFQKPLGGQVESQILH